MSAVVLDFDSLLAPIDGDNPAGSPVPSDIRRKLEEARVEIDDPTLPAEDAKKADWPKVVQLATETLTKTSKDLLVSARLTEGLVKLYGFQGLQPGLRLLRRLIEECWDRLQPDIEDGDLEVRAAPFNWLDVPDRSARFPSTLRMLPLVKAPSGEYSWLDWDQMQQGKPEVSREDFEKAVRSASPETCLEIANALAASVEELNLLRDRLNEKMGDAAPGLSGLADALEDCNALAQQLLARKRPDLAAESDIPGDGARSDLGAEEETSRAGRGPKTRADVYRDLAEAAARLQQLEPHSPVPHLIQYAVQLGEMPFPQLMRELIRNGEVINELNRILGIKESRDESAESS